MISGTPGLQEYDPRAIPWQFDLIKQVHRKFDYSNGFHDILLSGTVGSAKSMVGAHLGVKHCLKWPGARLGLGRRSMPDLKDTIFAKIIEHIQDDLREGKDYWINESRAQIKFRNGSKIIGRSWGDRKGGKKARSLDLSALLIEELTENDDESDQLAIQELKMRIGRVPGITENWCINMTNPDSPAHWAYKYYFESNDPNRHVILSTLDMNPFLPPSYKQRLLATLDPKTAQRMIFGQWIEIKGETIYHAYDRDVNFRKTKYQVNPAYPIYIAWDFNIGEGKPLSLILYQHIDDVFHFFDEVVVHNTITEDACVELKERGHLNYPTTYIIQGDATGKARTPAAKYANYEIIRQAFNTFKVNHSFQVPSVNPSIRHRHMTVNGVFKNALNEVRAYVYEACPVADQGFRLTKLKKGGQYVEDDTPSYQHITTAAGYGICTTLQIKNRPQQHQKDL